MGCAISGEDHRWPNRTIPFEISNKLPPGSSERNVILAAIRAWNAQTVIRLIERDGQDDFAEFVRGEDCSSQVGRQGDKQSIACSFRREGSVIHEIGHAVGLWHEQSRQDRDLFIVVHLENVQPGEQDNFDKHIDDGDIIGPYDFDSVMHYGPRSRAVDWRPGSVIEGQLSKVGPSVATTATGLHMVHLGDSSNNIWWSIFNGQTWNTLDGTPGNERIPGQLSKAPPALAVFNNQLHMVHLGDSSNNIWWSVFDGVSWNKPSGGEGNERIPGQLSKASPALAVFNNQLHMVHLGDSSNNIWTSVNSGADWSANRRTYNGQSRATPVMAISGLDLHMLHIGEQSNRIYQTLFDTSQLVLVPPPGVTIGLEDHLSIGDIQTVADIYP